MSTFDAGPNAHGRVLHRVMCPKRKGAHEVGRVVATQDGPRLRITTAVHGVDGTAGHVQEFAHRQRDAGGMWEAWCASCGIRMPFTPDALLRADGRVSVLAAEGMWKDGVGVLRRAATRRAERER